MDYHLRPLGKTCAATGRELSPGSRCHSVLVERDGGFVRLDYSQEGWKGLPEGSVGHWLIDVPRSAVQKPKTLDTDALMRSFEQMCEDESPSNEKYRYLLSLLLLQKRKLQITGSRDEDGVTYLELSGLHGEGPWELRDQKLAESEIEQLQHELNAQLLAEWTSETDETDPADS